MFWKWFWKSLAFLLILSIFVVGGIAIYRAGYTHGATEGLWTAEPGTNVPVPYQRPYHHPLFLLPFTGIFLFFIILLILTSGFRHLAHYHMWNPPGMPISEENKRPWHSYHHSRYRPGTCWGTKEPDQEKPGRDENSDDQEGDTNPK